MTKESPLKGKPLRNPGQGLDEELQRLWDERAAPYYFIPLFLCMLAGLEWFAYLRHLPRQPLVFTVIAIGSVAFGGWRLWRFRRHAQRLKLGRDGERAVGQFLERLRVDGARIFHDVQADGFNLDHVVIASQGLFVVETKTWSKPSPNARIEFDGTRILANGRAPSRDPIAQVRAEVAWLKRTLEESTGKQFPIRGVVVFPGWFVEPATPEAKRDVWVLEPKALPAFIEHEPSVLRDADVALAAFHLGRYVRTLKD